MKPFPSIMVAVFVMQLTVKPVFAEETMLRITLEQSVSTSIGQNLVDFKREVEEKAKGSVTVSIFDKAQFYLDYQVPEAVRSGAIEMGVAPLAQYSDDIPATGLFMQPFLFNFDSIIRAAVSRKSEIRAAIDAEIEKQANARVLWWQPYGPNVILGKGTLANPQAIADHNVRVFDDFSAQFVTLCGGRPHIVSEAKQAEAFEQNIVDSAIASIASVKDAKLWKRIDTISNIRHSENLFLVIINKRTFDSLSPEQQKIIIDAAQHAEEGIWAKYNDIEAETYAFAASKGLKIRELTPDDTAAWRFCSSSILESFMERAGPLGAKLFAAYGKLRADSCCSGKANTGQRLQ